jgi:NitT/TauT family transport system permease protein
MAVEEDPTSHPRAAEARAPLGGPTPTPSLRRRTLGKAASWALPLSTLIVLVGLWEAATVVFTVPRFILPAPSDIAEVLVERKALPEHTYITLLETVEGFLLATAIGIPLAVLIVYSRLLERTIYPILLGLNAVPKIAIAPILVLWMGFGTGPKVVVVVLLAIFPIVISTATGLKATPPELMELIRSLRASELQIFLKVRFPAALPHVFVGLKVAIALAVVGAVIGEFVGADRGLGFIIVISGSNVDTPLAFAAMVLLSVMSIVLFYGLVGLERLLVRWNESENR